MQGENFTPEFKICSLCFQRKKITKDSQTELLLLLLVILWKK